MRREKVSSHNLSSIGYNADKAILEVQFRESGLIYKYYDVSPEEYVALMNAESIGAYFNKNIRDHHPYEKVSH